MCSSRFGPSYSATAALSPRAWLFRVASNLWIDRQRRHRELVMAEPPEQLAPQEHTAETRDAGAALLTRISPQERAAILLKEAFDFTIDEIAQMLATTPGAVKAALHRGREKLAAPAPPEPHRVAPAVLNAFCEAFNAHDLERLVALMLETATAEIVGIGTEYGPDRMRRSDTGTLYHSLFSPISHAVDPWLLKGDRIAGVRYHFFSPDIIAEVCSELQLPWRSNGYRYWPLGDSK